MRSEGFEAFYEEEDEGEIRTTRVIDPLDDVIDDEQEIFDAMDDEELEGEGEDLFGDDYER